MNLGTKVRIGIVVVALALAVIVPAALASNDSSAADPTQAVAAPQAAAPGLAAVPGEAEDPTDDDVCPAFLEGIVPFAEQIVPMMEELGPIVEGFDLENFDPLSLYPDAEDFAAVNEVSDELAAYLDERGIDHDVHEVRVVTWDITDEAANEAIHEFLEENGESLIGTVEGIIGIEGLGDAMTIIEGFELPPEIIADINAEADDLAAFLDSQGIAYTVETDESGIQFVEWDFSDEAANAAVEEFMQDRHAGMFEEFGAMIPFEFGEFSEGLPFLGESPIPPECFEELMGSFGEGFAGFEDFEGFFEFDHATGDGD